MVLGPDELRLQSRPSADPSVADTGFIGGDGQVVHPSVGGEEPDGSGPHHVFLVDRWGQQITDSSTGDTLLSVMGELLLEMRELKELTFEALR